MGDGSNFESYKDKLTKDVNSHNFRATSDDLANVLNDHSLPLAQRVQLEQQVFDDGRIGPRARLKLAQSVVEATCAEGAYLYVKPLPNFPAYQSPDGHPELPRGPGIEHPSDIFIVERHSQFGNIMAPISRIGYFVPGSLDYMYPYQQPRQRPFIFGDLNNPYNRPTAQTWNAVISNIMQKARQREREIEQEQNPSF